MRHRIGMGNAIGLGNPSKELLDNKGAVPPKEIADKAVETYFEYWGGFDYQHGKNFVSFGIEPAYQGDELLIVTVHKNKKKSTITEGYAFGYYGSGIRKKTRVYKDYKYNSKFVRFVDEAHKTLFGGSK